MELKDSQFIRAPRTEIWEALNDPSILAQCITGCEELIRSGDNQFEGKLIAKVGPVKAKFSGQVTLSNIDAPNSYSITGEGKGGIAGFAKGGADISLVDQEDGTLLSYTVKAAVGGKLAQIGARLIDGVAREYAKTFFEKFCAIVEADGSPASAEEASQTLSSTTETPPARKSTKKRLMILFGLAHIPLIYWLLSENL